MLRPEPLENADMWLWQINTITCVAVTCATVQDPPHTWEPRHSWEDFDPRVRLSLRCVAACVQQSGAEPGHPAVM